MSLRRPRMKRIIVTSVSCAWQVQGMLSSCHAPISLRVSFAPRRLMSVLCVETQSWANSKCSSDQSFDRTSAMPLAVRILHHSRGFCSCASFLSHSSPRDAPKAQFSDQQQSQSRASLQSEPDLASAKRPDRGLRAKPGAAGGRPGHSLSKIFLAPPP